MQAVNYLSVVSLLEAADSDVAVDFGNETLEHLARAEFNKLCGAGGNHVAHGLCPAHGSGELCDEVGLDFGGGGGGQGVHVLGNGAEGGVGLGWLL